MVESRAGAARGFLAKTGGPERDLRDLLERDRMFTDDLREETARLGLPAITAVGLDLGCSPTSLRFLASGFH